MNRDNKRLGTTSFNLTRLCHNKKIINIILIINILQKQNQQCNKKIFIPRSAGERGGGGGGTWLQENIQKYEKEGRKDGEEELRSWGAVHHGWRGQKWEIMEGRGCRGRKTSRGGEKGMQLGRNEGRVRGEKDHGKGTDPQSGQQTRWQNWGENWFLLFFVQTVLLCDSKLS